MSREHVRTESVLTLFKELVDGGLATVRPGDIASAVRSRGAPMGVWQIRGELSSLAEQHFICLDEDTGAWRLAGLESELKQAG